MTIPVELVRCDGDHIRKSAFSTESLKETIADAGLLQPILARKTDDGFVVIDGARRLEALKALDVQELIVGRDIIIDVDETEADTRFKQIIANVQREDLNPVELGQAFVTLKETFGYQYNEISEIIGKTPHYVAAKVGLVKRLDPEVQRLYLEDLSIKDAAESENADNSIGPESKGDSTEKCIQNTFYDTPYVVNLNVLEDIARTPIDVQLAAYQEIRARQMDKDTAIEYLRCVKQSIEGMALPAQESSDAVTVVCVRKAREPNLLRYILKIRREVDRLADTMQGGARVEPDIEAEIEALIERLNALRGRAVPNEAAGADSQD